MRQRTISDYFWRDPAICDLSQEDKATLLYFLTSPSSNIIGVYQIVWAIAAAEMGWTKDQMVTVAKRLQLKGLIDFSDAGWIWVKIWWNHNSGRGAFSPKLVENAKKQCAAMPPEWLNEYLKSLEFTGVDRVSIGYPYPNDTPPANTTGIGIGIGTTTTTTADLVFPELLTEHEKKSILELMQRIQYLALEKQQELLDELAGAIRTKSISSNSVSFFNGLVSAAKKGTFIPGRGVTVFAARAAKKAEVKLQQQMYSKDSMGLDPEAMEKGALLINVPAHIHIN